MDAPTSNIGTLFPVLGAAPYDPILDEARYRKQSDSASVVAVLEPTAEADVLRSADLALQERAQREQNERAVAAAERARIEREEKERQDKEMEREASERMRAMALSEARNRQAVRREAERERERLAKKTRFADESGQKKLDQDQQGGEDLLDRLLDEKAATGYAPSEYSRDPRAFQERLEQQARLDKDQEETLLRRLAIGDLRSATLGPTDKLVLWRAYLRRIRRWGSSGVSVRAFEHDYVDRVWPESALMIKGAAQRWMSWAGSTNTLTRLVALLELHDPAFQRGNIFDRRTSSTVLNEGERARLVASLRTLQPKGISPELGDMLLEVRSVLGTEEYPLSTGVPSPLYGVVQYLRLRWQMVVLWGRDPVVDNGKKRVVF